MVNEANDDGVNLIDLGRQVLGATKDSVPKTGTGLVLGTVRYMAPEQLKRDGLVSSQTDLYSVGLVFYEMITGRTPYDGSPAEMAAAHLYHDPPTIPGAHRSESLDSWFARVMCKSPDERYLDALTMRADLMQCQGSDTIMESFSPELMAQLLEEPAQPKENQLTPPPMGVDAAVHTLDEEQDDEMEVTSESQNDLLALLNPIQEASGTIEIAAPIAMMERLTTTEDKQKTEDVPRALRLQANSQA